MKIRESVLEPMGIKGFAVLNKYKRNPSLLTTRDIAKLTGSEIIAKVPYLEYGWQAIWLKKVARWFDLLVSSQSR